MRKICKRGGMTLAETLLVVAILAVLAGVSGYSIVNVRRNSEQTRLDAVAETLYEVANNQIKELYAFRHDKVAALSKNSLNANLPSGVTNSGKIHYAVLRQGDSGFELILPEGSFSSEWRSSDSDILVEYVPDSAVVYSVFYADSGLSMGEIYATSAVTDNASDSYIRGSRDNRLAFAKANGGKQIGYFSGYEDGVLPAELPNPDDDLVASLGTLTVAGKQLSNGEELTAKVAVKLPKEGSPSRDLLTSGGLTLRLSVANGTENSSAKRTYDLEVSGVFSDTFTFDIVIDSFKDDARRFKNIFNKGDSLPLRTPEGLNVTATKKDDLSNATDFSPGEKIFLTLTAFAGSSLSDSKVVSNTDTAEDNSLFAYDTTAGEAHIRCFRHLRNLDASSGVPASFTAAKQLYDLDFTDHADLLKWAAVYGAGRAFSPIHNDNLASYDGGGHFIHNLTVAGADGDNAGLFGQLGAAEVTVKNLTLRNVTVSGGKKHTGGVVGYATGDIKFDTVKVVNPHISGNGTGGDVGGLIGCVDGDLTVTGCEVYTEKDAITNAEKTAGAGGTGWIVQN